MMIYDLMPVYVLDRSANQVIITMSSTVCTKRKISTQEQKVLPQNKITIFASSQSQKRNEISLNQNKLGPSPAGYRP